MLFNCHWIRSDIVSQEPWTVLALRYFYPAWKRTTAGRGNPCVSGLQGGEQDRLRFTVWLSTRSWDMPLTTMNWGPIEAHQTDMRNALGQDHTPRSVFTTCRWFTRWLPWNCTSSHLKWWFSIGKLQRPWETPWISQVPLPEGSFIRRKQVGIDYSQPCWPTIS